MSEPTNLEDLLRRQLLLQEKLSHCLSMLESLERQGQNAGLLAIARQMAIANEDRRAEKAAKEREKELETQRLNAYGARDRLVLRELNLS